MGDVHDAATRSYNMSRIRGKDTKPEMIVRKFLFAHGFRYRLHDKRLQGKPDLVLPKYKTVIFVHGCFWHGHEGCTYARLPESNIEFWQSKIAKNIINDKLHIAKLKESGWNVLIIWECELKSKQKDKSLNQLLLKIANHT